MCDKETFTPDSDANILHHSADNKYPLHKPSCCLAQDAGKQSPVETARRGQAAAAAPSSIIHSTG